MAESSGSVVSNNVNNQKQSDTVQCTETTEDNKTEKVMVPLLLEDFSNNQKPRTLINLFEFFQNNGLVPTNNDILAGLIYLLMCEANFIPKNNTKFWNGYSCEFSYNRLLSLSTELPDGWKKNLIYQFSFIIPPVSLHTVNISCIPMANDLLINCSVNGIENCYFSIMLDPLTYFTSSRTNITITSLQNLDRLSILFKNTIAIPSRNSILHMIGLRDYCLQDLPEELLFDILKKYLRAKDLVRLGRTSKFFMEVTEDDRLWKLLAKEDLQLNSNNIPSNNIKKFYKKTFIRKVYLFKAIDSRMNSGFFL